MATTLRGWSPPKVHDAYTAVPARAQRLQAVTARGHWSNCDVYGDVPASWVAPGGLSLSLWTLNGTSKVRHTTVSLWELAYESFGNRVCFLAASVRGRPSDGFEVTLANVAGVALGDAGYLWAECWGRESTPEAFGELPNDLGRVEVAPIRRSRLEVLVNEALPGEARYTRVRGDADGRIWTKTRPEPFDVADPVGSSGAFEADHQASGAPCRLLQVSMVNQAGAVRYLQLFDDTNAPGLGAVPVRVWPVRPMTQASPRESEVNFPADGLPFATGLYLGCSSTAATYTAAADGWFGYLARQA